MNVIGFPDRAVGIVPQRLADARIALQLSRTDVARELGVSGTTIGYYENGNRRPDMSVVLNLSRILNQPVAFFFRNATANVSNKKVRFFRSVGPKSNKINMALDVRTNWLWEFVQFLLDAGVRLPTQNVPFFEDVNQTDGYSLKQIEYIAARARRHWGMSDGPINNMVALLEANGVIVCRFSLGSEKIDAFSCWVDGRPYVLLGSDKRSAVRSRFDAAHELGHLILHRDITPDDMEDKSMRDRIEKEANWFAGSFLLPRNSLFREFYSTRSGHLKGLKQRWLVSMQAIAHRARDIGAIDENQYIAFRIQMTKRKELSNEPLDDVIAIENPGLLFNAWEKLTERGKIPNAEGNESMGMSTAILRDHLGRDFALKNGDLKSTMALIP